MIDTIKILVLGPENVGKTTLIQAITERLENKSTMLQKRIFFNFQQKKYEADFEEIQSIDQYNLKGADLCILMFDASKDALQQVQNTLADLQKNDTTILLIGNKSDQMNEVNYAIIYLEQVIKQVESVSFCSALFQIGLDQIIPVMIYSSLMPSIPLFDYSQNIIKKKFQKILYFIFRICDNDFDGSWNDTEIVKFHQKVFQTIINPESIFEFKKKVGLALEQSFQVESLYKWCSDCIKDQDLQIPWSILKAFLFNKNLEFSFPIVKWSEYEDYELSLECITFLKKLFYLFKDYQNLMPLDSLKLALFTLTDDLIDEFVLIAKLSVPLINCSQNQAALTQEAFVQLFQLKHFLQNPYITTKLLLQLGFKEPPQTILIKSLKKKQISYIISLKKQGDIHHSIGYYLLDNKKMTFIITEINGFQLAEWRLKQKADFYLFEHENRSIDGKQLIYRNGPYHFTRTKSINTEPSINSIYIKSVDKTLQQKLLFFQWLGIYNKDVQAVYLDMNHNIKKNMQ